MFLAELSTSVLIQEAAFAEERCTELDKQIDEIHSRHHLHHAESFGVGNIWWNIGMLLHDEWNRVWKRYTTMTQMIRNRR